MLLVHTYVASSSIEGVGVFAAEPIAAGELIWRLEPRLDRVFPEAELETLPTAAQAFAIRYGYSSLNDPGLLILELDNGRFMNHSATPNTRFDTPDAGHTLCDIQAGEEITCNYADFIPGFELPEEWRDA